MYDIAYSPALVPVRDAFAAAHTRFWRRLASSAIGLSLSPTLPDGHAALLRH